MELSPVRQKITSFLRRSPLPLQSHNFRSVTATGVGLVVLLLFTSGDRAQAQSTGEDTSLQTFTVEKSAAEKAAGSTSQTHGLVGSALRDRTGNAVFLPPKNQELKLGFGLGYVQGADYGMDFSAEGMYGNLALQLNSSMTQGARGFQTRNAYLRAMDVETGRVIEAGFLGSPVWGRVEGARYSWRMGRSSEERTGNNASRAFIGAYSGNSRYGNANPVLTFGGEWTKQKKLRIGGEIATDGSGIMQVMARHGALQGTLYTRVLSHRPGTDAGVSASYTLGHGIAFYGGLELSGISSGGTIDSYRRTNLGVQFPLLYGMGLTLNSTHSTYLPAGSRTSPFGNSGKRKIVTRSAQLSLPTFGPVHLLTRYQWTNADGGRVAGNLQNHLLSFSAGYTARRLLNLEYQMSLFWSEEENSGGRIRPFEQLVGTVHLSPRTNLQTISDFPQVFNPERLRVRLNHNLGGDLSLSAEYGLLQPYQGIGVSPNERGLQIMLRQQWGVATPARGGEVQGHVLDNSGHPVPGVVVRLGNYHTITDAKGMYRFPYLPTGKYAVSLDKNSLPADYLADSATNDIVVTGGAKRQQCDFRIALLGALQGRVYGDTNKNGVYDSGEGVRGIVLYLDDHNTATVTDGDGGFGFFNVAPGSHSVRLDRERLLAGFAPASAESVTVEVTGDQSPSALLFRLRRIEKSVEFQEIK